MKLNRASYEMLKNSISLYLSYNDMEEEDIIIRILGNRPENITDFNDYLSTTMQDKSSWHKIYILMKQSNKLENRYMQLSEEEILKNTKKACDLKLDTLINIVFLPLSIINSISDSKCDIDIIDENEINVYYDLVISSKGDLISHIVNNLLKDKVNIAKEDYHNSNDKKQLCLKI